MTEVTGVIIAEYVAMITVVTKMTMTVTDVTETGITGMVGVVIHVIVVTEETGLLEEMTMIEKGNVRHLVMIDVVDLMILEGIPEILGGDLQTTAGVLKIEIETVSADQDHHQDQKMSVDVQRLEGDRMRREEGVRKRKLEERSSDSKQRPTGISQMISWVMVF